MKRIALSMLLALFVAGLFAQKQEPYQFKDIKRLAATEVKNQDKTGTCWAFSTASMLESEALRLGKGTTDLSEMFIVRHIYRQKCENYVRRQGTAQFGEGGLAHDVFHVAKQHGIVPESAYPGRKNPNKPRDHSQLEKDLKSMCDDFVAKGKAGKLSADWLAKIDSMLDAEFGKVPLQFEVGSTMFTPASYRDFLDIKPDDYVNITSFTHHPFYEKFILEVPDNWANGMYYNLPINDMMRSLNYALQQGYSVAWDADVSNMGFSSANGIAIVPQKEWAELSLAERQNAFKNWEPERTITQEYRQELFDRQVTVDDHLMHIVGRLDEAHGGDFYAVKNSWGEVSDLKGYLNVSEAYMRLNTIAFTLHKNALPADIQRRLGIQPDVPKPTGPAMRPSKTTPTNEKPSDSQVSPAKIQPRVNTVQPKTAPNKNVSDN